ncbi:MAG TPA: YcxB family protein [Prolixibacteraceae bacterium]|nr:YcxB family protein [Prolixibacteraceae bacterium]
MNDIKIDCKLSFKRYVKLCYYISYQNVITILLTIIGLVMLVLSILSFSGITYFNQPPTFQLMFGLILCYVIPAGIYGTARKRFKSNSRINELITYVFTNELIHINGESFKTEMTWNKLYKIKELNNWILIYITKDSATPILKDSFNELQLKRFKDIVRDLKTVKVELKD